MLNWGFITVKVGIFSLLVMAILFSLGRPPQGGQVVYVGAEVRSELEASSTTGAKVRLIVTLSDDDDVLVLRSTRNAYLELSTGGSYRTSAEGRGQFVHLVLCPNFADRKLLGPRFRLRIDVEHGESAGFASRQVQFDCSSGEGEAALSLPVFSDRWQTGLLLLLTPRVSGLELCADEQRPRGRYYHQGTTPWRGG